jgi:heme exporter protein D
VQWGSVGEFIAMGGYGPYVWGAYGMLVAALTVEVWLLRRRRTGALRAARASGRRDAPGA